MQNNSNDKILQDRELTTEQNEIVHFTSEGVTPSTTAVPDIVDLSTDYLSMTAREERIHTIKDFLSRPIVIKTDTWDTTKTTETQLYTANFPEVLIANQMYAEKLKGFVGLRATLVIKVQVNSQPFQQGRLMLQYFPYAQYMPNRVALVNATLQGRSGCPRTDLDLSVGTEIEMRIPYVSPHVYYNLITGQGSFGAIYLVVYSQLRDQLSGTGSVEYTVWAHMEDVDIQYPTGAALFTGSSPNFVTAAQKLASGNFTEADAKNLLQDKTYDKQPAKIFAQVGSELTQMGNSDSISAGIGQLSERLSSLSTIPILGNVFSRPAWISKQTTNIFKMLGFSKPTIQGLPSETKLRGQTHMANFDGADTSHKMALSGQNEIETKTGLAGTSADEMEMGHILSIPNYWDRFSWATSSSTNTVLWTGYVTPFTVKSYSSTIKDRFRATHMGYVANAHGLWRGSIVYTFKFVKTQYHSGRLLISFIPFYFNSTISTGTPDISRTQKMIVDMRTATEVSFTVPYVSSRPWMYCIKPDASWLGKNQRLMYSAVTGIVRVEVLNQLVAANNVYQSIDTIVEVNGGPDLTFALPTLPSYVPYSGGFTAETAKEMKKQEEEEYGTTTMEKLRYKNEIHAQVMGENEAIQRNDAQKGRYPTSIDTHPISSNWSPEAHCTGEKIMSVRQLIKRFGPIDGWPNQLGATDKKKIILAPFSIKEPTTAVGAAATISMFEYYYYLYAFWRGSMRYKCTFSNRPGGTSPPYAFKNYIHLYMWNSVQDTFNSLVSLFTAGGAQAQSIQKFPDSTTNMGPSTQIIDPNIEGLTEFEVPYYNISHISPATLYTNTEKPLDIKPVLKGHIPPVIIGINPQDVSDASENTSTIVNILRAPGDDYSLMYLVGVPPLVNVKRS